MAAHGHVATDENGLALVIIDEMEERKLRWKAGLFLPLRCSLSLTPP